MATSEGDTVYTFLVTVRCTPGPTCSEALGRVKDQLKDDEQKKFLIHKYKVIGEPVVIAVFKVPVSSLPSFQADTDRLAQVEGVAIDCDVLVSYEKFARETLGVPVSLTERGSDNYVAGLSPLLWLQYTVNYGGRPANKLIEDWKKEATAALTARENGLKVELYKVAIRPKLHIFISMTPDEWEKRSAKLPLNEDDVGSLDSVMKAVHDLDSCYVPV